MIVHSRTTDPNRPSLMDAVLLYGTFGLLMFGPLAFGAVEPWSTFILEAGSALLAILLLVSIALNAP